MAYARGSLLHIPYRSPAIFIARQSRNNNNEGGRSVSPAIRGRGTVKQTSLKFTLSPARPYIAGELFRSRARRRRVVPTSPHIPRELCSSVGDAPPITHAAAHLTHVSIPVCKNVTSEYNGERTAACKWRGVKKKKERKNKLGVHGSVGEN